MLPIAGVAHIFAGKYRNIWFYSIFIPISSAILVCAERRLFYLANEMANNLFGTEQRSAAEKTKKKKKEEKCGVACGNC